MATRESPNEVTLALPGAVIEREYARRLTILYRRHWRGRFVETDLPTGVPLEDSKGPPPALASDIEALRHEFAGVQGLFGPVADACLRSWRFSVNELAE